MALYELRSVSVCSEVRFHRAGKGSGEQVRSRSDEEASGTKSQRERGYVPTEAAERATCRDYGEGAEGDETT
jgi:hypothetical protein